MLKKIKLRAKWIYEVVMESGGIHRAPMGIWTKDFESFMVDVYKDSSTYSNLKNDGIGSVYFVEDPKYFAETKELDYFAKVDFKVIASVSGNPSRFVCKVLALDVVREGKPFNRARGLFLEYLVDRSRRKKSDEARKRYLHFKSTIKKVAPGSVYDRLTDIKWKR